MTRKAGFLLLVVVWFCWGFSYPSTKLMLQSMDVWTGRALIMGGAGILLLMLAAVMGQSLRVARAHWRDLIIAALLNMTIFQISMTLGVHYFSAGRTVVIVYTMPLWAMLFAWPLLQERPTLARLAALALGLIALVVLMGQDFSGLRDASLGAACTLVGAIAFGLGTVWMKRRAWTNDPTVIAGWQLVLGTLPVIPCWYLFSAETDWAAVSAPSWAGFAFNLIIANVLAYFAWFRVLSTFPASVSGLGTLAVPIVGVLASAALLGEQIGWREITALALIVLALGLNLRSTARP
ncbi:MAG: DMT family transporter [Proteobacteria bacterium]|nr:DMT family transporter [Pseudomonadota bacterium]